MSNSKRTAIYDSIYSPGKKVSIFHIIIELVCENQARKSNEYLPAFFWRLPKWEKKYKSQLRAASKLCNEHTDKKVYAFVNKFKIFSLQGKKIEAWIADFKYTEDDLKGSPFVPKTGEIKKTKEIKGLKKLL